MTASVPPRPATGRRELLARVATGAALGAASWVVWSTIGLAPATGHWSDAMLGACALGGALMGLLKRVRALTAIVVAGGAACLVIAYTPLTGALAPAFVRRDPATTRRSDAVVVLASGATREGALNVRSLERLLSGLALMSPGDTTPLVTSVVRGSPTGPTSSEDIRRLTALSGGRNLILVTGVFTTHDEAMAVQSLAAHRGWHVVTVVTSPSHSRRACATFERAGLTVHCAPSTERSFVLAHLERPPERLEGAAALVYETLAAIVYRLRGWT